MRVSKKPRQTTAPFTDEWPKLDLTIADRIQNRLIEHYIERNKADRRREVEVDLASQAETYVDLRVVDHLARRRVLF